MNENLKKALLVIVCVAFLALAVYEGMGFVSGPKLEQGKSFGHGTPGHGMKAAEKADEARAKAGGAVQDKDQVDPLAGPSGKQ